MIGVVLFLLLVGMMGGWIYFEVFFIDSLRCESFSPIKLLVNLPVRRWTKPVSGDLTGVYCREVQGKRMADILAFVGTRIK